MNHIADVPGLRVGHASDHAARTGSTVVVFDEPAVCAVDVRGGAPGTRETDALRPGGLSPPVDAVCLSGGSAFGLAAGDGAQRALLARGRGFSVREQRIPIVPAAILFDLEGPPADFAAFGAAAVEAAFVGSDTALGTIGAGVNATTAGLKGGIGAALEILPGAAVGALVAVNAVGSATAANGPWFRAAPFERGGEFGGLITPPEADLASVRTKLDPAAGGSTVIAVVATDARLTRGEAQRLAACAHDGIALAIYPAHTLYDGDTVFAASTARAAAPNGALAQIALGAAAARALARAIARAVHAARPAEGDRLPAWQALYGGG